MSNDNRTLPHDLQSEKAVLGAVLVSNDLLAVVMVRLSPDAFYRQAHRQIYRAMLALNASGEPIDALTVYARLEQDGSAEEAGGLAYIASLTDGVPRASNIESYAKRVTELAALRALIRTSSDMMAAAYDQDGESQDILDKAAERVLSIAQGRNAGALVPMSDIEPMLLPIIERHAQNDPKSVGVSTGFQQLDRMLWGLKPGQLVIVAARPAMGKTSWIMNVAQHVGMFMKRHVAVFSLEMTKEELGLRLLAQSAEVSGARLIRGTMTEVEYQRVGQALQPIAESRIYVDDSSDATPFEIRAKARAMKGSVGLDLVVVDYLQLMHVSERTENRNQEIAQISRHLKMMAKELHVPVVALSQLSRGLEARKDKRPMLSDLRESGALEQDADVVLFIYRDEVYQATEKNRGAAEIIIGKNRGGPQGTIDLQWFPEQTRFADVASAKMWD